MGATERKQAPARSRSRIRTALAGLTLSIASLLFLFLVAEILLRAAPRLVPKGSYFGSGVFVPEVSLYLPKTSVIYDKARYVRRWRNRDGFMDVDHAVEKPNGVLRAGIFGDSYVESVQYPLEEVFFRRIPTLIEGRDVETFAFGISGTGTANSLALYRWQGRRYDLDVVIYVFVANDIADNSHTIQQARRGTLTPELTARLSSTGSGFEMVWPSPPKELALGRRLAMSFKNRSFVARVVLDRLQLLLKGSGGRRSNSGEGPSVPAAKDSAALLEAQRLTELILEGWNREVRADGREFIVLYTPQGDRELSGELAYENTWHPWLAEICDRAGIPLVDATGALRAGFDAGDKIYEDHWTLVGHGVIATVLRQVLEDHLKKTEPARALALDSDEFTS